MSWKEIIKVMPWSPQTELEPPKQREIEQPAETSIFYQKPEVKVETKTNTGDDCQCAFSLCKRRATWRCNRCSHRACTIHKTMLVEVAKDGHIHHFTHYNCKTGQLVDSEEEALKDE
jgi:hypothetical protein